MNTAAVTKSSEESGSRSTAVLSDIRQILKPFARDRLDQMFKGAAQLLLELSDAATEAHERRLYLDTIRSIKTCKDQVHLLFMAEISALLKRAPDKEIPHDPADLEIGDLKLQADDLLEEMVAISNIAARFEGQNSTIIWETDQRLATAKAAGVPLQPTSLMPMAICQAFRKAAVDIQTPLEIKLIIFKVFEHFVIRELTSFYSELINVLGRHGFKPQAVQRRPGHTARFVSDHDAAMTQIESLSSRQPSPRIGNAPAPAAVTPAAAAPAAAAGQAASPAAASDAPAPAPQHPALADLSPQDVELLGAIHSAIKTSSAENAAGTANPAGSWARNIAQRVALAGGFLDTIVSDHRVSADIRQALENLRFSLLKVSVADESFFSSPQHPLRTLLEELHTMSLTAQVMGGNQTEQMTGLVNAVRAQLDLPPDKVSSGLQATSKVRDGDVAGFLQWQDNVASRRRTTMVNKIKSLVNEEISSRLATADAPESAAPTVINGLGPLMCMMLARHGRESIEWKASLNRLDNLVDSLRVKPLKSLGTPPRDRLLKMLELDLRQVGMAPARIEELLKTLREAYQMLDQKRESNAKQAVRDVVSAKIEAMQDSEAGPVSDDLRREVDKMLAGEHQPGPGLNVESAIETAMERPAPKHDTHVEDMAALFSVGSWFRVHSPADDSTKWLKVSSYYPRHDMVAFATFDGQVALSLKGSQLIDDLRTRKTEAVAPDSTALKARDSLIQALEGPGETLKFV